MKSVICLIVLAVVAFACKGDEKTAAPAKFAQPAAGPVPPAMLAEPALAVSFPVSNCDGNPCEALPLHSGGNSSPYFARCLFVTHHVYWQVTGSTCWQAHDISANELSYYNTALGAYSAAQAFLAAEVANGPDTDANYCVHSTVCTNDELCNPPTVVCPCAGGGDSGTYYWPVAWSSGACDGVKIHLSQAFYDEFTAASNNLDCALCILRSYM